MVDHIEEQIINIKRDINILKMVITGSSSGSDSSLIPLKLKILKPKLFGGNKNSKELKNFLWDIEQYFKAIRI